MLPVSTISRRFRLQSSAAHKNAKQHHETGNIDSLSGNHIRTPSKLSFTYSKLLESIVQSKGSFSRRSLGYPFFPAILAELSMHERPSNLKYLEVNMSCFHQLEHILRHVSTLR